MPTDKPTQQKIVRFPRGTVIFDQADVSRDLYIIKSGTVRVYKREGGLEIDLGNLGSGGVVGEVAAIDGGNRSATVEALTDVEAFCINDAEFNGILTTIPEWFQKIARILVQRLREVDQKMDATVDRDKTRPAAALIAMICHTAHAQAMGDGSFEIPAKFLENEIMDILSLPVAQASECLQRLVQSEFVAARKNTIVVKDKEKLARYGYAIFNKAEESPVL